MKLIQAHGQPHYGYFADYPSEFNIQDYQNPFLTIPWQRTLRYKKFSFIGITHPQYQIGLAIADLAWVGHAFYYCYHRKTGQYTDLSALQIFPSRYQVQDIADTQQHYFKHHQLSIDTTQHQGIRHVQVRRGRHVLCEMQIEVQVQQALNLCSPTGVRGFTFTHKNTCLPVSGYFNAPTGEHVQLDYQSLANLDESCGFFRPETEWFWLSCQTLQAGQQIGLNLASGVNESVGNENCLWLDGQLYVLPDVIFYAIDTKTWRIYSLDGQVELLAETGWRRYEQKNLLLVASQFSQWLSAMTGTIQINGQIITLQNANALLEQHFARW